MTPPAAAAAAPARAPARRPRRPIAPSPPRRVSGPARPPARARTVGRRARSRPGAGLGAAVVLAAVGVCEHRLLDRFVRGRVWIGLVTFALLGIVTLQLGLLQLNGSIGRELARKAQLLRENSTLSIENSTLASDEHVISAAAQAGMVPVSIKSLRFLDAHAANPARAADTLRAPVQPPASEAASASGESASASHESASASGSGSEASSTGEPASTGASPSSPSSSSAGSSSSEASQPAAPSSQGSEASGAAPSSSASGESGASSAPVSESGGSASGGTARE